MGCDRAMICLLPPTCLLWLSCRQEEEAPLKRAFLVFSPFGPRSLRADDDFTLILACVLQGLRVPPLPSGSQPYTRLAVWRACLMQEDPRSPCQTRLRCIHDASRPAIFKQHNHGKAGRT